MKATTIDFIKNKCYNYYINVKGVI
jgi:hypothetical protein